MADRTREKSFSSAVSYDFYDNSVSGFGSLLLAVCKMGNYANQNLGLGRIIRQFSLWTISLKRIMSEVHTELKHTYKSILVILSEYSWDNSSVANIPSQTVVMR